MADPSAVGVATPRSMKAYGVAWIIRPPATKNCSDWVGDRSRDSLGSAVSGVAPGDPGVPKNHWRPEAYGDRGRGRGDASAGSMGPVHLQQATDATDAMGGPWRGTGWQQWQTGGDGNQPRSKLDMQAARCQCQSPAKGRGGTQEATPRPYPCYSSGCAGTQYAHS